MDVIVKKSVLKGEVSPPRSKSVMQRAIICSLIKGGKTELINPVLSEDDLASLRIAEQLGGVMTGNEDRIILRSKGINCASDTINFGESGLALRMFLPLISTIDKKIYINGSGSLPKRDFQYFSEIFNQLNVEIKFDGNFPKTVEGPIKPNDIEIDGSESSQYLTGLLMTYSYLNVQDKVIKVNNLNSKPYIDLTLDVLRQFGHDNIINNDYKEFKFTNKSHFNNQDLKLEIESDWSGASFLIIAGILAGDLIINGLNSNSKQGDRIIYNLLKSLSYNLDFQDENLIISKGEAKSFIFDATDNPDLFPPLIPLAAKAKGRSKIIGIGRLKNKESNRAETLISEYIKLGVKIFEEGNSMVIDGEGKISGGEVDSHNDHRVAMSLAVTGIVADDEVRIKNAETVNKSYKNFFEDLIKLNGKIIKER